MANLDDSLKRIAISKASAQTLIIISVASFVTIFCLVASWSIWKQISYQSRVISTAQSAKQALNNDITAAGDLIHSYEKFDNQQTNVIGGQINGNSNASDNGSNAKIILDALPSTYDFPALTTSVEKILNAGNFTITGITGTDEQLAQQGNTVSQNPQPVGIPFGFSVNNTNYPAIETLIGVLQLSIRPIQIDTLNITGGGNQMNFDVSAHTFYQPGKSLILSKKVVQ